MPTNKQQVTQPAPPVDQRALTDGRVAHDTLLALIGQRGTRVLRVTESYNDYGEWLFVTLSAVLPRRAAGRIRRMRQTYTFYGLGYHERRERWIAEVWDCYPACRPRADSAPPDKASVLAQIAERHADCRALAAAQPAPGDRAGLYAALADLTDDDAADCELADLAAVTGRDDLDAFAINAHTELNGHD
jgi:hypothetical protein